MATVRILGLVLRKAEAIDGCKRATRRMVWEQDASAEPSAEGQEGEEEDSSGLDMGRRRREVGGVWRTLGGEIGRSRVGFGYPD